MKQGNLILPMKKTAQQICKVGTHDRCRQLWKKVAHLCCLLLLWPIVDCLCSDRLSTFKGQETRCRCRKSSVAYSLQLQMYVLQSRVDIKEIDKVYKWHMGDTFLLVFDSLGVNRAYL